MYSACTKDTRTDVFGRSNKSVVTSLSHYVLPLCLSRWCVALLSTDSVPGRASFIAQCLSTLSNIRSSLLVIWRHRGPSTLFPGLPVSPPGSLVCVAWRLLLASSDVISLVHSPFSRSARSSVIVSSYIAQTCEYME